MLKDSLGMLIGGAISKSSMFTSNDACVTHKVFWRGVLEELLWFIGASTNAKVIVSSLGNMFSLGRWVIAVWALYGRQC